MPLELEFVVDIPPLLTGCGVSIASNSTISVVVRPLRGCSFLGGHSGSSVVDVYGAKKAEVMHGVAMYRIVLSGSDQPSEQCSCCVTHVPQWEEAYGDAQSAFLAPIPSPLDDWSWSDPHAEPCFHMALLAIDGKTRGGLVSVLS